MQTDSRFLNNWVVQCQVEGGFMDKTFQKFDTEDFYDFDINPHVQPPEPEWKVYFNGNFWGHHGKDRAGIEIPLGKEFTWANHSWVIPAAYSCSKGLVMDFCMQVDPEAFQ